MQKSSKKTAEASAPQEIELGPHSITELHAEGEEMDIFFVRACAPYRTGRHKIARIVYTGCDFDLH